MLAENSFISPNRNVPPPIPIAWNSVLAASEPCWPALWISAAAFDSGNGNSGSSTITRLSSVTNRMPNTPPTSISALDCQYASTVLNPVQVPAITNAGIVKIAPAATLSPIEPTVRAMFSSRIDPRSTLRTAMPMTAAG